VEVIFTIFDTYHDRVTEGSLVELNVSPIGALGGAQFLFYPGLGEKLVEEMELIPEINSYDARQLSVLGLTALPVRDDSIGNIITQVNTTLETINPLLAGLHEAFEGTGRTSLGRTLGGLENTMAELPETINQTIRDLMLRINPILENLEKIAGAAKEPDSTIMAILDSNGPVYKELVATLSGLSGNLINLERTTDFIPSQLPQLAVILSDLSKVLKTAEDVLTSLTNNPILKGGIPEYKETKTGGARPRDYDFTDGK